MLDIINLLPDAIANQIAAGEVVQRPASVVKELLENSVDAGSTRIQLVIQNAGKTLIQVIDNGKGMTETDARMCFERHATSKIQSSEDLFKIKTMGFRGEALASIAAVARVELKTKNETNELGTFIHIETSEVKKQIPVSLNRGTSIAVKNLFYNVPARRNFLKSNPVEIRHIIDEFQRVAIANPVIEFCFTQNDKEIFNLTSGKLSQRIIGILGNSHQKQLIACSEKTTCMEIYGYVGTPAYAKKTRGEQFFFINNRFIKSGYLNHAVTSAFEGLIQNGQYPFYTLFIEMDPIHIDINVHPTKTEVKFDDERSTYAIVKSAVKQALGTHHVTPALDFSTDTNFTSLAIDHSHFNTPTSTRSESQYSSFKSLDKQGKSARWDEMHESAIGESQLSPAQIKQEEMAGFDSETAPHSSVIFQSNANQPETLIASSMGINQSSGNPTLIHDKFILKQVKAGVMIVDVHLADERILFEKYHTMLTQQSGVSQRCLFPVNIDLNLGDFALAMELKDEISTLGFEFEAFGKHSIAIHGIPAETKNLNEQELFEGLIEQFKRNQSELSLHKKENLARSIAKRSANKTKIANDSIALGALIDRLFACTQPNYTPQGTPTFVVLGIEKIKEFFNY